MPIILYSATQARADQQKELTDDGIEFFNQLMEKIQTQTKLQASTLDVYEVTAFAEYGCQAQFEAQGYVVTAIGTNPVFRYVISW